MSNSVQYLSIFFQNISAATIRSSQKRNAFFISSILMFLLSSCATTTKLTVPDEEWKFEKGAVSLKIESPSDLNAISGRPHALTLGVFQLSDPNTFQALSKEQSGAIELLTVGRIDDTIVDFQRVIIQPGENKTEVFSRAQNSRYIGIISGYYDLSPTQDVYLFKIPCKSTGRGIVEELLASLALISDEADAKPDKIYIDINLGSSTVKKYLMTNPKDLTSECS
ncbi:MAG: type VI secretion system lipoprotein TssJ [Saccharospirillaceae bacterium]|nr:type VI secretion system lipoprotein TssJ [Pseudomonadales bacterium]NRB81226.1 type VI secretion system lipoprotein TssJ [Saccharospirillaceae bacterium]